MIIDLKVTPEEADKILMGLEAYKGDLTVLANRLVEDAKRQIEAQQMEQMQKMEEEKKKKEENGEQE